MIRVEETFWRKRAMAAPDRMDLFPMSAGSNPKVVLPPKLWQVARNSFRMKVFVICKVLFSV
jgi:hypothetical protein